MGTFLDLYYLNISFTVINSPRVSYKLIGGIYNIHMKKVKNMSPKKNL